MANFSVNEKPHSSRKTTSTSSRRAFFYSRPVAFAPRFNTGFIPFQRAIGGLLNTKTELVEQASQIVGMIDNGEVALNELLDSFERPAIGSKTRPQRPCWSRCLSWYFCRRLNFDGRPVDTRRWSRRSPPVRNRWAHLDTAVRLTPNCRAISAWDNSPACSSLAPARRRSSNWARVKRVGVQVINV